MYTLQSKTHKSNNEVNMSDKNIYTVTLSRGDEVESMEMSAINSGQASFEVLDHFFYDGWHVVSSVEKVGN